MQERHIAFVIMMLTLGVVLLKSFAKVRRAAGGQLATQQPRLCRPHLAGEYALAARYDPEAAVAKVRHQHAGPAHDSDARRA